MSRKWKPLLSMTVALSLLTGCGGQSVVQPEGTPTSDPVQSVPPVHAEQSVIHELTLRLLKTESAQKPHENVILSPMSIEMALGMAANGAAGDAKATLNTFFGLNSDQINLLLKPYLEREDNTLSIANGMWFQEKMNPLVVQSFKDTLSHVYHAEEGGFTAGSADSVQEINRWVNRQTHGKIPTIVTKDTLSDDTLALLINALYFNGKWEDPFEDYQVSDGLFHTSKGDENAEFMSQTLGTYFETDTATGFSKRYRDGYEFIGILPKEEGEDVLSGLDLDAFLRSETYDYDVEIKIPKFELEYSASLKQTLTDLGLGSLFEDHSMDGVLTDEAKAEDWQARITDVIHKTYMKMYEEGTEAAAVTTVVMAATMAMPVQKEVRQVFLDRPFAFLIRDTESGQIVFCGTIHSLENGCTPE